jgi:hypothetical protein
MSVSLSDELVGLLYIIIKVHMSSSQPNYNRIQTHPGTLYMNQKVHKDPDW